MRAKAPLVALALLWLGSRSSAAAQPEAEKLVCVQAAGQGQTDRDERRLLAARRELLTCARDACPAVVRKSCALWLADLETRIPSIVVRVVDSAGHDVSDAHVSLDGAAIALNGIPIALDPGRHQLQATAVGGPAIERTILVAERELARLISVTLEPEPTPGLPPGPRAAEPAVARPVARATAWQIPTGAFILGAAGVLALGSFAYFAVAAKNELDDLKERCSPSCSKAQTRSGRNQALVADVSLGLGIGALATAAVWTLWAPHEEPHTPGVVFIPTRTGASCQWTTHF